MSVTKASGENEATVAAMTEPPASAAAVANRSLDKSEVLPAAGGALAAAVNSAGSNAIS